MYPMRSRIRSKIALFNIRKTEQGFSVSNGVTTAKFNNERSARNFFNFLMSKRWRKIRARKS